MSTILTPRQRRREAALCVLDRQCMLVLAAVLACEDVAGRFDADAPFADLDARDQGFTEAIADSLHPLIWHLRHVADVIRAETLSPLHDHTRALAARVVDLVLDPNVSPPSREE